MTWRQAAAEILPGLVDVIREADNPYLLWISLRSIFADAYRQPQDRTLIHQIYAFADWCCRQPRGETAADDLLTCVAVCFYEHIPEIPQALDDLPNWFTEAEFDRMREVFCYHASQETLERLKALYTVSKAGRPGITTSFPHI